MKTLRSISVSTAAVFAVCALSLGFAGAVSADPLATQPPTIESINESFGSATDYAVLAGAALTMPETVTVGWVGSGGALTAPGAHVRGNLFSGAALTAPGAYVDGGMQAQAALTAPDAYITGFLGANGQITIPDAHYGGLTITPASPGDAITDVAKAYNYLSTIQHTVNLPSGDLGGRILAGGVYRFAGLGVIQTGDTLTLDAVNDPNAVFIIQAPEAFNFATNSRVVLANGAQASHVFFLASGAIGVGNDSVIAGSLFSGAAVSIGTSDSLSGRVLSTVGAVSIGARTTIKLPGAADSALDLLQLDAETAGK